MSRRKKSPDSSLPAIMATPLGETVYLLRDQPLDLIGVGNVEKWTFDGGFTEPGDQHYCRLRRPWLEGGAENHFILKDAFNARDVFSSWLAAIAEAERRMAGRALLFEGSVQLLREALKSGAEPVAAGAPDEPRLQVSLEQGSLVLRLPQSKKV